MPSSTTIRTVPRLSRIAPRSGSSRVAGPGATPPTMRRMRVSAVAASLVFFAALTVGAGSVLASRGGDPSSTPTARPATTYVVEAGDTLWGIAAQFHGRRSQTEYVDRLMDANGGSGLSIGQVITLP